MSIDPTSDRAAFRQLADLIREQIHSGALPAGARLPSEPTMAQQHGLGRETVRRAMGLLRMEGLVITVQGEGTRVREAVKHSTLLRLGHADRATVHMPSPAQRRALGLDEGVPVIEVCRTGTDREIHAADRTEIAGLPALSTVDGLGDEPANAAETWRNRPGPPSPGR